MRQKSEQRKKTKKTQRQREQQQQRQQRNQQPHPPAPSQERGTPPPYATKPYAPDAPAPGPHITDPNAPAPYAPDTPAPTPHAPGAHPRTAPPPSGTARGHFPSRPAARLAGLTDRAGGIADRIAPRSSPERLLDLALGTAFLIAAAPVLAAGALALAVRRGPDGVWDRSPRTGLGGRVFTLRSLRTRRLRLDLLSRLPHVVRGDLSLVGPAPLAPGDPRAACPGARQWRQELRPGLTGLAQVRSGSGMPWDDPALLDQHYAEHHGVVLYLAVLAEAVRNPLRTAVRKVRPGGGTDPVQPRHT
ncbi:MULTISPECIES: sugar transferase [Streptomyces]|uniref:sugar transferase n=1 Tax=Streptomyces TaxID=1883 RepID=UPI001644DC31|nr:MULTISPECIES: sugar transferase [Streptomyces]MBT3077217.1 sugar transferase [Streptomyces sp. COG21]MBT3082530.1 sugar transferase [Streptomyces sp. COG20]MBT3087356.1 sugar transferase [Streptomyces sp. CYG21]MBT3100771.1 sugar transferase [Streptomyces sp. CBG30]MBT3104509.1 sugar transferase [Streptomyces sp. COG19]